MTSALALPQQGLFFVDGFEIQTEHVLKKVS
jgi:hypothetical protein